MSAERVSWELREGDCIEQMRQLDECSVDAVVTDPPYNLNFMAKPWDNHGGQEDAGFAYWLAGLIDGEGHFAIKKHTRGTHAPAFTLKMRADEMGTLEQIERTLRIGSLSLEKRKGNPMAKWTVQDKQGCQRLVDLLDKYPLRAKKRLDYATWREAVCEWTRRPRGNRWHGGADDERMAELRERLMRRRGYVEPAWSGNEFQDWCRLWGAEALRVAKPGAHLLAFGGTRTSHRLVCGLEDAGWEIRDSLIWIFGQGFPKSLSVHKASLPRVESRYGNATCSCVDPGDGGPARHDGGCKGGGDNGRARERSSLPPKPRRVVLDDHAGRQSALARVCSWCGLPDADWLASLGSLGSTLKPGHEPIILARKPLIGTVSANVLAHGTGALNIDGCRIGTAECPVHAETVVAAKAMSGESTGATASGETTTLGRWPSNVALGHTEDCRKIGEKRVKPANGSGRASSRSGGFGTDYVAGEREALDSEQPSFVDADGMETIEAWNCSPECPVRMLDEQSGELVSGSRAEGVRSGLGFNGASGDGGPSIEGSRGGASRFFYCAKASSAERSAGLPDGANTHPTVKPIDLMRWLVRLVTPPGGTVLDPFTGSGSTGCAAVLEGFDFIGIEREAKYAEIACARIAFWEAHPEGLPAEASLVAERERLRVAEAGQLSIELDPERIPRERVGVEGFGGDA